jgi:hypothetical protein
MSYKVEEFLREDGSSPYEEWFMRLDAVAAVKITNMALTRDFKETIKKRATCDLDFSKALLHEAVDLLLDGD